MSAIDIETTITRFTEKNFVELHTVYGIEVSRIGDPQKSRYIFRTETERDEFIMSGGY